jgi:hypothetical protein
MNILRRPSRSPAPAAEQQQPAEGQRVGVDHPFQAGPGKAERPLDVRQRDVDDGRVQHHHQLRGGQDRQRQARARAARGHTARHGRPGGLGSCFDGSRDVHEGLLVR